jgi:3-phenylpropionate/trans-cinnamate dioxygenase ferredoxin component
MARVSVGKVADIPRGKMIGAEVEGEKILVANVDGSFHAMRSICNHAGGPLQEGKLEGKIVTCPWHGSKWDVTSGSLVSFMRPLPNEPVYKVAVEGGEVFVET